MQNEIQNTIFKIMLANLNRGVKRVTVYEIEAADSEDDFPRQLIDETLSELAADGLVLKSGYSSYDITADIGTLRNYIINCAASETRSEREPVGKVTLINSSWRLSQRESEKSENPPHRPRGDMGRRMREAIKRTEALDRHYRDLLKRMESQDDDDDEDDDDDDFDFDLDGLNDDEDDNDGETSDSFEQDNEGGMLPDDTYKLYVRILKVFVEHNRASVGLIKTHFPVGTVVAFKAMRWLEDNGYILKDDDMAERRVLVSKEYFNKYFGKIFESTPFPSEGGEEEGSRAENPIPDKVREGEPSHSLWGNEEIFETAVMDRITWIVASDKKMGRLGALKMAEYYYDGVKDTCDQKKAQVYERVVYEFKVATNAEYRNLKKSIFGPNDD